MIRFGSEIQVVPVLAPVDTAGNALGTAFVNISKAHWITFHLSFGVITDDTLAVKPEVSIQNADSGTEADVKFRYRLSGAVGSDSWGAITDVAAGSTITVAGTADGASYLIDVDPADVTNALANADNVRLLITPGASSTVCLLGAVAFLEPRYPALNQQSSS